MHFLVLLWLCLGAVFFLVFGPFWRGAFGMLGEESSVAAFFTPNPVQERSWININQVHFCCNLTKAKRSQDSMLKHRLAACCCRGIPRPRSLDSLFQVGPTPALSENAASACGHKFCSCHRRT